MTCSVVELAFVVPQGRESIGGIVRTAPMRLQVLVALAELKRVIDHRFSSLLAIFVADDAPYAPAPKADRNNAATEGQP